MTKTAAGVALAGSHPVWAWGARAADEESARISVDFSHSLGMFPHFWERATGSDRFAVGLREQWRQDLIRVHRDTGMQSVRAHGLFDDEGGIASQGGRLFNFLYVDQIYDFMIEHGVRPYVELSFMPEAYASAENRIFAYHGNTSPPRDWKDWTAMVTAFTEHCVKRYGIREVEGWKFEVWNEPNIVFWAGSQQQYFELYRQSAGAVKAVNSKIAVGGPSTALLEWIPDLIQFCTSSGTPLDFLSTHAYPDDPQRVLFGKDKKYPFEQVIPRGLQRVKDQVAASKRPDLPVWLTEWSSQNPAFIADTINSCIGLAEALSFWTFSNVFEETGVPTGIFNGTYGMMDQWGIPRPSLHAFALLHKLGDTRKQTDPGPVLATTRQDGSHAVLLWNVIPAKNSSQVANGAPQTANAGSGEAAGAEKTFVLRLEQLKRPASIKLSRVGAGVGTAIPKWKEMGSPRYPSADELKQLRAAAELPPPETIQLQGGQPDLTVRVPANSVVLLEIEG